MRREVVTQRYCPADCRNNVFFRLCFVFRQVMTIDFCHDDQPFATVHVDRHCGDAVFANCRVAMFHRHFDVRGIVIYAADNQQVFESSADEKVAVVNEAQVAAR